MSDFKFSCPKCGQSILCDTSNAGMQIPCPACQTSLTVPAPPPPAPAPGGKLSINKTAHAHQPPPPAGAAQEAPKPAWGAKAAPPPPKKTSLLAIAALVCSLLGGIGAIPGIICGHLARTRIARDRSLKGAGLALAGLIISYLSLALIIGWYGFGAPYLKKMADQKAAQEAEAKRQADEQAKAAKAAEIAAAKKRAGWNLDLSVADFPDRDASGKIHSVNFTVEAALFSGSSVVLQQTNGSSRIMQLASLLKPGESFANLSLNIATNDTNRIPKITLAWRDAGAAKAGNQIFTNGYAMKLEFGSISNGVLPGRIYLSLPDPEQSYVGGNFEIALRAAGAPGAGQRSGPGQPGGPAQPGGGQPNRRRGGG
jgi:hypothetical protein